MALITGYTHDRKAGHIAQVSLDQRINSLEVHILEKFHAGVKKNCNSAPDNTAINIRLRTFTSDESYQDPSIFFSNCSKREGFRTD